MYACTAAYIVCSDGLYSCDNLYLFQECESMQMSFSCLNLLLYLLNFECVRCMLKHWWEGVWRCRMVVWCCLDWQQQGRPVWCMDWWMNLSLTRSTLPFWLIVTTIGWRQIKTIKAVGWRLPQKMKSKRKHEQHIVQQKKRMWIYNYCDVSCTVKNNP